MVAAIKRRLDALESKVVGFTGPGIWIVLNPGESSDDGLARYEAEHGPALPGQPAIIWRTVATGVPRERGAICG